MFKIKTLNKISPAGLAMLDASRFAVSDSVEKPEGILVRSADMLNYEFNETLQCIARAGAGTNNIPIQRCSEEGIVVFNTPGANANAVKELAICALYLSSRDVFGGIEWVKSIADKGDEVAKLVEKGKSAFVGPEVEGKSLGVIGLGAVGVRVANIATKLGMTVYGYDPFLSVDAAWSLSRSIVRALALETIYKNCDYITLHIPSTAETKGMINADSISMMKSGVRIINLARGELVDDADMIQALESGKVAKYVTDFPNGEIVKAKNVLAIPHLGASTPESEDNCAVMAANQIKDYLENGVIRNSVNLPNVDLEWHTATRLCVIHKNIPNMLSGAISILAAKGINIENMMNKSKKDYAYTLLDIDAQVPEQLVDQIRAIDGIIRVRALHHG